MYILELCVLWTIHVMKSSISIGSVPVMDSGIINKWNVMTLSDWCVMAYKSQQPMTSDFPMGTILSVSDGPLGNGKGTPYVYVSELEEAVQDTHVSVMYSGKTFKSYEMKFLSTNSRKTLSLWEYRWWSCNVVYFNATWKLGTVIIFVSSESSTGDGIM